MSRYAKYFALAKAGQAAQDSQNFWQFSASVGSQIKYIGTYINKVPDPFSPAAASGFAGGAASAGGVAIAPGSDTAVTALAGFGVLSSAGEFGPAAHATFGNNGKIYWPKPGRTFGWGGGSKARIITYKIGEVAHRAGVGAFIIQTGVEGYETENGSLSPWKFGADTTFGALAFIPPGAVMNGGYWFLDTFYPGGAYGFMTNYGNAQAQFENIPPYAIWQPVQ